MTQAPPRRWGLPSVLPLVLALGGCAAAPPPRPDPRDRYYAAVGRWLAGDARGCEDGLIALAHEAPDTRAGRRARATLRGGDLYATAYVGGILAAIAVPQFAKYQARARQREAPTGLMQVQVAQMSYRERHSAWCPDVTACGLGDLSGTRYVYFLTDVDVRGGDRADDRDGLIARARTAMGTLGLQPRMGADGFLAVAAGDLDDDEDIDLWTIDESGGPFQLANDREEEDGDGLGPSLGL